jgi:hypothetical protein
MSEVIKTINCVSEDILFCFHDSTLQINENNLQKEYIFSTPFTSQCNPLEVQSQCETTINLSNECSTCGYETVSEEDAMLIDFLDELDRKNNERIVDELLSTPEAN